MKSKSDGTGARAEARSFNINRALPKLLGKLDAPGEYYGLGAIELPVVRIVVDGIGMLGLPISPEQAAALAAVGGDAPYGRGADTLVDPAVRRCKQIDAAAVQADDPRWLATLAKITADARRALGVEDEIVAEPYKMLVYEPGGFFVGHRDTPKSAGMFATLVVSLPSAHEGGELVVQHDGREVSLDLSSVDVGVLRWAAFYADCRHELRPLRSGFRVALVYNLCRRSGKTRVPDARPAAAAAVKALRQWADDPDGPIKIVIPLTHKYTPSDLTFAALKNEDAAAAQVLVAAAREASCVVRLAMASISEEGSAEPVWDSYGRGSRQRKPSAEYDVIEVIDRTSTLDTWHTPEGAREERGAIELDDDEVAPPGKLDDEVPDEDHLHEATGNEGASFERTYRCAALVLWPASRELDVIAQGGIESMLAALERFEKQPDAAAQVARLATMAMDELQDSSSRTEAVSRARLTGVLSRQPTSDLVSKFLSACAARGAFDAVESSAWIAGLARLATAEASEVLAILTKAAAPRQFCAVARLLNEARASRSETDVRAAVEVLIDGIARMSGVSTWEQPAKKERVQGLVDLLRVVERLGVRDLGERACNEVLAHSAEWGLDEVVIPALRVLLAGGHSSTRAPIDRLFAAAVAHLRARTALPLDPPADAAREVSGLECRCEDCAQIRAFLSSKEAMTWALRAAQPRRSHAEGAAKAARVDVDMTTERRGSPHSLVFTKNAKRHEYRVKQRSHDLAALADLSRSG